MLKAGFPGRLMEKLLVVQHNRQHLVEGTIADTHARLLLWCRREPKGLARVEFSSEFARQQVVSQLRSSLQALDLPVHEITLPLWEQPETILHFLLEQLNQPETGVVSINGFATAFDPKVPQVDALRVINYNREALAKSSLRQVWWMTRSFTDMAIHAMPDLNSWFTLRLFLTEDVVLDQQLQIPIFAEKTPANVDDARRRAKNLMERFEQAQAAGMPSAELLTTYGLPAIQALSNAGAEKEAQSLATRLDIFPIQENAPDVASGLTNVGLLYSAQGHYFKAESLFTQALELRQQVLGKEHLDVANSLNKLASLYHSQGRYSEAEPLFVEVLELKKRLLGEAHLDVVTSVNNLAALYYSQGRYGEAEPLYVQVLELRKRLLGEEHLDIAGSLYNLALLYESQGRYSEAEPLLLQALELYKRLLGEDHPSVAASLNSLAGLYTSQGRHSEAEPLYLQALALRKRLLGEEHPDVAASLNNLAILYNAQGRYSEAESCYVKALELNQRLLGQEHPDVAISANNLAWLYKSQGHYSEAEPLYQQALGILERKLGKDHPYTIRCRHNLSQLHQHIAQIEPK